MELLVLLVIVVIIGALLGAKSFGGTIRTGCGCISLGIVASLVITWIIVKTECDDEYNNFEVTQHAKTYIKPDIRSEEFGYADAGEEVYVEDINKYKYFYELESASGDKYYILKENLRSKETGNIDVKNYSMEEAKEFITDYYSFYNRDVRYRGIKIRRVSPNKFKVSIEECSYDCSSEFPWDAKVYDLEIDSDGDYTYERDYL